MAKRGAPHPTLVDAASLFDASEFLSAQHRRKVTIDYARLRQILDTLRAEHDWRNASPNSILLSIDPDSDGQLRFQAMLGHAGFEPDVLHYRDVFVSLPAGRTPKEMEGKSTVSMAPRIAYIAGLMAQYDDAQFLVVSHAFEICGPLVDLRRRLPKGKVGLAYFGCLLDYRWKLAGLFDGSLGLEFFDLDAYGVELAGVDLVARLGPGTDVGAGLHRY